MSFGTGAQAAKLKTSYQEVNKYLIELVSWVRGNLKQEIVGINLFGSASYRAFEREWSHLDIQAATREPLVLKQKHQATRLLRNQAGPCLATMNELVAGNLHGT